MIEFVNVRTITQKELRDAMRNRWFIVFTIAFAGLALALSALTQPTGTQLRAMSYSRTAANLINLVLLFVPLIGPPRGSTDLAGGRATGALVQQWEPAVGRIEVRLGNYFGLAGALLATLTMGFGVAGAALVIQRSLQDAASYLMTVVLSYLLALAMLSLGTLMSTLSRKTTTALGGALFLWLFLVFIGDLGIMGTAIATQMSIQAVFFVAILNPLQMFKIASILTIQANLEVLGPAGLYATDQFGALLPILLIGLLLLWIVLPLLGAMPLFARQAKFVP